MDKKNGIGVSAVTEHILVCLSASPSNARIMNTVAKTAKAFVGGFTDLYVETPNSSRLIKYIT